MQTEVKWLRLVQACATAACSSKMHFSQLVIPWPCNIKVSLFFFFFFLYSLTSQDPSKSISVFRGQNWLERWKINVGPRTSMCPPMKLVQQSLVQLVGAWTEREPLGSGGIPPSPWSKNSFTFSFISKNIAFFGYDQPTFWQHIRDQLLKSSRDHSDHLVCLLA